MSGQNAFKADGKSFSLSIGAAVTSTPVRLLTDLGISQMPQAVQIINNGANDVWVSIDNAANAGLVFPVAGSAGAIGTPSKGVRVKPGAILVYYLQASNPTVGATSEPGFVVNAIGAAAGPAIVDFTCGEGV